MATQFIKSLEYLKTIELVRKEKLIKLLRKIFTNIIENPNEQKYKEIILKKLKNKTEYPELLINILKNAGFIINVDGTECTFNDKLNELQLKHKLLISFLKCTNDNNHIIDISEEKQNPQQTKSLILSKLLGMGFDERICSFAIEICNDNLNDAIQFIIDQNVIEPQNKEECKASTSPEINCDLLECSQLTRSQNWMKAYETGIYNIDTINISQILNDFIHLLSKHNQNENEFKMIYNKFGFCNIENCKLFKRNNRDRNKNENGLYGINDKNKKQIIIEQILDKIHCFYMHCFDIGYKLTNSEKDIINEIINDDYSLNNKQFQKLHQLLAKKHATHKSICPNNRNDRFNKYEQYSYGYRFWYSDGKKNSAVGYRKQNVPAKYKSFKEELINNSLSTINVEQLSMQHIMAVMIYCNYTALQYEFTKTFRKIYKNEADESLIKRHSNFYYLGKYLKESVATSGCKCGTKINKFYHGINKDMLFPKVGDMDGNYIFGPVSTSIQFEVAVNFTNNNGIIVEFRGGGAYPASHLAVFWLSDYGNESEHLFIGETGRLQIVNIISVKTGSEYKLILKFLRAMANYQREKINGYEAVLFKQLLSNELSFSLSKYKTMDTLDSYAQTLIHRFCVNKINLWHLTYKAIGNNSYSWFFEECACLNYQWINVSFIEILFPKCTEIFVEGIKLCALILDDIVKSIGSLKRIDTIIMARIDIKNSELTVAEAISKYFQKFWDAKCEIVDLEQQYDHSLQINIKR
eukprot:278808_1